MKEEQEDGLGGCHNQLSHGGRCNFQAMLFEVLVSGGLGTTVGRSRERDGRGFSGRDRKNPQTNHNQSSFSIQIVFVRARRKVV